MSDLIERLRREGYTIGGWDDALSELDAQQAEIARLRLALFAIEGKCLDCETINLIGKTCEAKIAGTLRNAIKIAGSALENAK